MTGARAIYQGQCGLVCAVTAGSQYNPRGTVKSQCTRGQDVQYTHTPKTVNPRTITVL
jgi:hypothetical protein